MMATEWRLNPWLVKLLEQIDARAPHRSKKWDGSIGDTAHQAKKSDHNPNEHGIVNAIDITHDPANGFSANVLAELLRRNRDPRIKYVIWNQRIFSSLVSPWQWRPYKGAPHDHHIHISVGGDPVPWDIGT